MRHKKLNVKGLAKRDEIIVRVLTENPKATYASITDAVNKGMGKKYKFPPVDHILRAKERMGLPIEGRSNGKPTPPNEWVEAVGLKPAIRPDTSTNTGLAKAVKALREAMLEEGIEELVIKADHVLAKTVQEQVLHC